MYQSIDATVIGAVTTGAATQCDIPIDGNKAWTTHPWKQGMDASLYLYAPLRYAYGSDVAHPK